MTKKEIIQHNIFLNIAEEIAKQSKCISFHVGAILVSNGRIISTGYNGTPANYINCDEFFNNTNVEREIHHSFSDSCEIHAEVNSILYAAIHGVSIKNCDIYITHQPCFNCLKLVIGAGIKNIYYRYPYDKANYNEYLIEMIKSLNIKLIQIPNNE